MWKLDNALYQAVTAYNKEKSFKNHLVRLIYLIIIFYWQFYFEYLFISWDYTHTLLIY